MEIPWETLEKRSGNLEGSGKFIGLQVIKKALKQDELKNKKEVLFARISAYESLFDFDTAYKYTKAYVKAYPKDAQGKKELTFLETR